MSISLRLALILALALTQSAAAQWRGCPNRPDPHMRVAALDTGYALDPADPATKRLLAAAKARGVTTIIRYYDWAHDPGAPPQGLTPGRWEQSEALCQKLYTAQKCGGPLTERERQKLAPERCTKTLTPKERDLILASGFNIVVVFQHFNECVETWTDPNRGAYDAKRALELASALDQPKGTAIYFGVDGADEKFWTRGEADHGAARIKRYFETVAALVRPAGYRVGVYGSGYACTAIKDRAGLADFCWLSQSKSHTGTKDYEQRGDWSIKQCLETKAYSNLGGTSHPFDPDVVSPAAEDFGQWRGE